MSQMTSYGEKEEMSYRTHPQKWSYVCIMASRKQVLYLNG